MVKSRAVTPIKVYVKARNLSLYVVTEEDILLRFADSGGLSWRSAVRCVGVEFALTDETGRPLTLYARRVIATGRKIHRAVRRDYLERQRRTAKTPKERLGGAAKLARAAIA